jgi:hypothetical protein
MTKNLEVKTEHLLPWEEPEEYEVLFATLLEEHAPQGPTERHLVEELAGIIWRKQRVGLAEAALHRHGLNKTFASYSNTAKNALAHVGGRADGIEVSEAVSSSPDKISSGFEDALEDRAMTENALKLALNGEYDAAITALREDTRDWWLDIVEEGEDVNETPREASPKSLAEWIESEALPWIANSERRLIHVDEVRSQAYGESLDPRRYNELGKWEAYLDRKFEKTVSMLVRFKQLRMEKA